MHCCYRRILSRLRSKNRTPSWKRGKRPVTDLLLETLQQAELLGCLSQATLNPLLESAASLAQSFRAFESYARPSGLTASSQPFLADLIKKTYRLRIDQAILETLKRHKDMKTSTVESLPKNLGKVGHYFAITKSLFKAAANKKNTFFRQISVEVVKSPPLSPAFNISPAQTLDASITAIQARILASQSETQQFLRQYGSLDDARLRFNSKRSALRRMSVHAEVQLLLFYESHPHIKSSRILCSSKSACFLCSLFIQLHGKFVPHDTHGRVYPLWALPTSAPCRVVERMNLALETKVKSILESPARRGLGPPEESLLHSLSSWTSMTVSTISSEGSESSDTIVNRLQSSVDRSRSTSIEKEEEDTFARDYSTPIPIQAPAPRARSFSHQSSEINQPDSSRRSVVSTTDHYSQHSHSRSLFEPPMLQEGVHTFALTNSNYHYTTKTLSLVFEIETDGADFDKIYSVSISNVNEAYVEGDEGDSSCSIINVDSLCPDTEITTPDGAPEGASRRPLRLRRGGNTFEVSFRQEDPSSEFTD